MAEKKTNKLTGARKENAKKVFGGEKKGLSKKLSDFVSGVKKRKAKADMKASDKVKAKKTATTAKKKPTAVSGTMKGKQVDTTKGPNYNTTTKKTAKRAPGSKGYKPTKTDQGPNMSRGTKQKTAPDSMKSTSTRKTRPATGAGSMKSEQKRKQARGAMGMARKMMGGR